MSLHVKEIELVAGDPTGEAWLEVHHAANRAVWGEGTQRTSIEEILDVAPRRHEVRRTFVVLQPGVDGAEAPVAAAQTIRRTRENVGATGVWLSVTAR